MRALLLILALALAGCAHTVSAPVVVCPREKPYTQAQQDALAAALEALPETSALVWAMTDYGQLRAAVRACHGP
jgi:hypothetical protein